MNLSTQPYKGTRDYYPQDKRIQNYIFDVWRKVSQQYGYEEYGAPILEPLDIYAAKTGQEIVNEQTYQFIDRGGRNVAIRPEMTPSVSRMVAAKLQELPMPLRWFSIANFMRYERSQRGREREFWQLNVDIFGVPTLDAEVEIIGMADDLMKAFGAKPDMYVIKINSRRLINFMMSDYLGLDIIQAQLMVKLFDRKDKITPDEFRQQAEALFDDENRREGIKKIAKLIGAKTMADLPREITDSSAISEVQTLFTLLREHGVKSVIFDISLMRGLDYYTDIVFEVYDTAPENNRALFGGGRYDGLVGLFGVEPVQAVGFAPGATTMQDFLETHDLLPKLTPSTEVYVVVLGEVLKGARKLASQLREEGVNVELDITGRKIDKQIKTGVKKGVPFILFVGQQELDSEEYTLKDIVNGSEQKLGFERLVTTIKDFRYKDEAII